MKKYDVTISMIIIVEAEDEKEALDAAITELEESKGLYPYVADSEVVEIIKLYETPGKPLLMEFIEKHTEFKLIPDEKEYVVECAFHGLVSTGLNVLEVIIDLSNHKMEDEHI